MSRADRFIVRIEQVGEIAVEHSIVRPESTKHELLEEPCRVRPMPFCGAGIGHRLYALVLIAQSSGEVLGEGAYVRITLRHRRGADNTRRRSQFVHGILPPWFAAGPSSAGRHMHNSFVGVEALPPEHDSANRRGTRGPPGLWQPSYRAGSRSGTYTGRRGSVVDWSDDPAEPYGLRRRWAARRRPSYTGSALGHCVAATQWQARI